MVKNKTKMIEYVTIKLQNTDFNLKLEMYSSSIFSFEQPTRIPPIIIKIPNRFGKIAISVFLNNPVSSLLRGNPELKNTGNDTSGKLRISVNDNIPKINDGMKIIQPIFLKWFGKSFNVFMLLFLIIQM